MMNAIALTENELAMWLHAAKAAHTAYEAEHGPDADWPEWYANWIWENAADAQVSVDSDTPIVPGARL